MEMESDPYGPFSSGLDFDMTYEYCGWISALRIRAVFLYVLSSSLSGLIVFNVTVTAEYVD